MNPKQMKNIVLITFDSLRFDKVNTNKMVDQLKREGVFFNCAYSQGPFTPISIPSFLTGFYPSRLKYILYENSSMAILEHEHTISTVLKNKGYTTAAIHSNPFVSRKFGYAKGYDLFIDNYDIMMNEALPVRIKKIIRYGRRLLSPYPYLPAHKLNKLAFSLLEGLESPFFLWLHYMDTHGPYINHNKNPYLQKIRTERLWQKCSYTPHMILPKEHRLLTETYESEISYTMGQLRLLLGHFRSLGLMEKTYFMLTADHGDEFGEHGYYSHPRRLFETLTHVPLILLGADFPKDRSIDSIVELTSIFPTICDLIGAEEKAGVDGFSLLSLIDNAASYPRDYAICEASFSGEPKRRGIREGNWKYIYEDRYDHPENQPPIQMHKSYSPQDGEYLFDLTTDGNEQVNVARDFPDVSERLKGMMDDVLSDDRKGDKRQDFSQEDEEITKKLKALGYL